MILTLDLTLCALWADMTHIQRQTQVVREWGV
jgi:hypothetical protein